MLAPRSSPGSAKAVDRSARPADPTEAPAQPAGPWRREQGRFSRFEFVAEVWRGKHAYQIPCSAVVQHLRIRDIW
jgi:hypothetical protein